MVNLMQYTMYVLPFLAGAIIGVILMSVLNYGEASERDELLNSCRTYICGNCKTAGRYDNYVVKCSKCVFRQLKKYRKDDAE